MSTTHDGHTSEAAASETATSQVYRLFIRTTPQALWEAITRPEFTRRYFYGSAVETDSRVDGTFDYLSPDGTELWSQGTVLEWDPPHRLSHTWRSLYDLQARSEPASRVTWQIEERDGICLLTVTHDWLEDSPATARGVDGEGWTLVLCGLKSVLETGEGLLPSPEGSL